MGAYSYLFLEQVRRIIAREYKNANLFS